MPSSIALIDFTSCRPDLCDGGICQAQLACGRKLIRQEKPGEMPIAGLMPCPGCGDCARACSVSAIRVGKN